MAKKSLGQNFLKSSKAISDIVSAGRLSDKDVVLEIGPGKGALTEKLLETGAKVVAVEADRELIPILQEKFASEIESGQMILVNEDILNFNPKNYALLTTHYKLISNIPYYITGAIIRKFLETDIQPELMVLLVQKEVAERIVARDGKESILSMSVKAYGKPKYITKVSARYFTPEPKVDSAVILIDNISKENFKKLKESDFFTVVKTAFGQKRKTLAKNLGEIVENKEELVKILAKLDVSLTARAEDLTFLQMFQLARELPARPNVGHSGRFPQKSKTK